MSAPDPSSADVMLPSLARAIGRIVVNTGDLTRFRTFYEGLLGLPHVITLRTGHPPFLVHAVFAVGSATALHVFELPGCDGASDGAGTDAGHRSGIDHVALLVDDEPALLELRDRLVEAGASNGTVTAIGPFLSVCFRDPDGMGGEINCPHPAFDPSAVDDELIECSNPQWTANMLRP
jgi:catechol 2,3-dioxygenase-like lactoylglutathione lyase family enzyme